MPYLVIGLVVIGMIFGFGYLAGLPSDNTDAIGEINSANARATENKIQALENRLAGKIELSEAKIQAKLEKNRLESKHNTEKTLFFIVAGFLFVGCFGVIFLSLFFVFSELKARRMHREIVHLHEIGAFKSNEIPQYFNNLPVYHRERG